MATQAVTISYGNQLQCQHICKNFNRQMHGTDFVVEMLPITLGGCDLVLKIQGLATLETIKWNFKNLEMKFHLNRKNYVLRGLKSGKVQMMTQDHLLNAFVNASIVLKLLLQAYNIVVVNN